MDNILSIGEVAYSNALKCNVICVEDDYEVGGKYGCGDCIFNNNKRSICLSDMFTDKFECRYNYRPDSKDVHYEKYGQN